MPDPFELKILKCGNVGPIKWSITGAEAWPDRFILRASISQSAEGFHQGDLETAITKAKSMASGLYHLIQ